MKHIAIAAIALSCAIIVAGTMFCISRIMRAAYKEMARQPEVADKIKGSTMIPLALMEGAVLMGVGLCFVGIIYA